MRDRARTGVDAGFSAVGARRRRTRRWQETRARDTYESPSSPLVRRILRAAADSSSSRFRFAAATPSWIALPTGWSGSVTISRALCAASLAFITGSLPDSSMVLLLKLSTWLRPGPDAMYAPATTPISPPRMHQPKPPPPLFSSATANLLIRVEISYRPPPLHRGRRL